MGTPTLSSAKRRGPKGGLPLAAASLCLHAGSRAHTRRENTPHTHPNHEKKRKHPAPLRPPALMRRGSLPFVRTPLATSCSCSGHTASCPAPQHFRGAADSTSHRCSLPWCL